MSHLKASLSIGRASFWFYDECIIEGIYESCLILDSFACDWLQRKGTWKYKDGMIELRARRTLFDMYVEIYGTDASIKQVAIQFSDRFGPNTLKMENSNL